MLSHVVQTALALVLLMELLLNVSVVTESHEDSNQVLVGLSLRVQLKVHLIEYEGTEVGPSITHMPLFLNYEVDQINQLIVEKRDAVL